MKKSKFLIGTALLSAALLGTGYAAWTETLGVVSTVSTGNFNVEFVDSVQIKENVENDALDAAKMTSKFAQDRIDFTTENIYPGFKAETWFQLENKGTVAARLAGFEVFEITGSEQVQKHLKIRVAGTSENNAGERVSAFDTGVVALEEINAKLFETLNKENIVNLNEGKQMEFYVSLEMDTLAQNDTQDQAATFSVALDWEQYNTVK